MPIYNKHHSNDMRVMFMNFDVNAVSSVNAAIDETLSILRRIASSLREKGNGLATVVRSEDSSLSDTFIRLSTMVDTSMLQAGVIFRQLSEQFNKYIGETLGNQDQTQSEIEGISNSLDEIFSSLQSITYVGDGKSDYAAQYNMPPTE